MTCNKITKAGERLEFVRAEIRRAGGTTTPGGGGRAGRMRSAPTCGSWRPPSAQLVADTGGTVDEAAVRRYHRGRADVSGFTVSDAAMAGDLPGALEALRWAYVGRASRRC